MSYTENGISPLGTIQAALDWRISLARAEQTMLAEIS
jgi:hypothetical protein